VRNVRLVRHRCVRAHRLLAIYSLLALRVRLDHSQAGRRTMRAVNPRSTALTTLHRDDHSGQRDPARRCGRAGTAVHARSNADDLALVPGWRGPAQCRGGRAFRAGGSWLAGGDDRRSPIDSLQLTVGRPLFGDPIASGIQPSTGHDKGAAAGCCWLQLSFRRRRESAPAQTQGHHTVCTHRAAATGCAS
jgi:hypothetical protein